MATVSDGVTLVRERINELTAAHWTDNQLKRWLNEGCRDFTRRTLCVLDRFTIDITADVNEYSLTSATTIANLLSAVTGINASHILRIDRVEWLPGDDRVVPLSPVDYDSMDALWGSYQDSNSGDPAVYTTWGNPPFIALKIYPAPSITSDLRIFCRRLSRPISTSDTTQVVDVPEGWEDAVWDYTAYRALQNDHDPAWQQYFSSYESRVLQGIDSINDYTRAQEGLVPDGIFGAPAWLVYPGYD